MISEPCNIFNITYMYLNSRYEITIALLIVFFIYTYSSNLKDEKMLPDIIIFPEIKIIIMYHHEAMTTCINKMSPFICTRRVRTSPNVIPVDSLRPILRSYIMEVTESYDVCRL